MKTLLKRFGAIFFGIGSMLGAPSDLYHNQGLNPDPVVVDAITFLNTGTFVIGQRSSFFAPDYINPVSPYETQNTLYYTNTGSMSAIPGFNLQYIDESGSRKPASQIYNGPGATISGEFASLAVDVTGFPDDLHPLYGGYVSLSATNIISRGTISGFYAGSVEITGENVDLGGSKVGNAPLDFSTFSTFGYRPNDAAHSRDSYGSFDTSGSTSAATIQTFFTPETEIRDLWWRYGYVPFDPNKFATRVTVPDASDPKKKMTNLVINTGRFGVYYRLVENPAPDVSDPPFSSLTMTNCKVFVFTNQVSDTEKRFEMVFVEQQDTNVVIDVSWTPGNSPDLPSQTAYIRFTTVQPDLVNQGVSSVENQFVLVDNFPTEPLPQLLINNLTLNTQAPTNLFAFRAFPPRFVSSKPIGVNTNNSTFVPELFTTWYDKVFTNGMKMTNLVTTNMYVTYAGRLQPFPSDILNGGSSAVIDSTSGASILDSFGISPVPGSSLTNISGRVVIDAKDLNLRNTRIQGQGMVSIRADNLKSSLGAVIDAPILNYDLGSTNRLEVKDLAKGSVTRFGGNFYILSTTFTNTFSVTDTNGVTSNYFAIYHTTVVKNTLSSGGRSFLNDLTLRAPVVDIKDQIVVDGNFKTTAQTLGIGGTLRLLNMTNLTDLDVPNLQYLTNSGSLSVSSFIGLGIEDNSSLKVLDNSGSIYSSAVTLSAGTILNSGSIIADGGNLNINATHYVNAGGSLGSLRNISLKADDIDLAGVSAEAYGSVTINASKSIKDGGADLPGLITTAYGFNLINKPVVGNLLGTAVSIEVPDYSEAQSYWAASDLGASRAGYTNNAALGTLSLNAGMGATITFTPVSDKNAIYVEHLDISDSVKADIKNIINLQNGMTLYFSSVSTNINPASLDGLVTSGGGTIRLVKDSNSPTLVMVDVATGDGRVLHVPRSLRFSTSLDSDGDGLVNASDPSPFDLVVVSQVSLIDQPIRSFEIQWNAAAGQSYQVQSTSDLGSGRWVTIKTVTNSGLNTQRYSVRDPLDGSLSLKAYRVIVTP